MYRKEKIDKAKTVKTKKQLANKNSEMEEFLINIGAAAKDDLSKVATVQPKWPLKRNENSMEKANFLLSI